MQLSLKSSAKSRTHACSLLAAKQTPETRVICEIMMISKIFGEKTNEHMNFAVLEALQVAKLIGRVRSRQIYIVLGMFLHPFIKVAQKLCHVDLDPKGRICFLE